MMEDLLGSLPEFPHSKELSLGESEIFKAVLSQFPPSISEMTFTNLFIWRHKYQIRLSRRGSLLCLLADRGKESFYLPPVGAGDVAGCCRDMLSHLQSMGAAPKVARVPEEVIRSVDWDREGLKAEPDRDQSDYVYLVEELVSLKGRKYHRKRNHITQFKSKYSSRYVPISAEWIPECLRLQTEWCNLRQCEAIPGLASEFVAIKEAFAHFEELGLRGGAILIEGRVEAFSFGEPLNAETVVIHIEKANPAFDGLYPMINQAFLEQEWSGYRYVNREQDLGEEGLRKAKESYFPHHMVDKHVITLR